MSNLIILITDGSRRQSHEALCMADIALTWNGDSYTVTKHRFAVHGQIVRLDELDEWIATEVQINKRRDGVS